MSQIRKALERAKAERLSMSFMEEPGAMSLPTEEKVGQTCGHLDRPVTPPDEVEFTETRVIEVDKEVLLRNRIVAVDESDGAAEPFGHLRTQIFKRTRSRGWNTIQVTSFGIGEGKSTLAANLAVSIAKDTRHTTLLVDLDFRRPSLARLLGLGPKCIGLKSYFLDDIPIEKLLVSPGIRKLAVLPAGGKIRHAAELLGSPKMEALISELKERYGDRYIIFDTPGINVCPDPLIISEYVDCIILVARNGCTTRDNVKAAAERIPKDKILGIIMNDVVSVETGYY